MKVGHEEMCIYMQFWVSDGFALYSVLVVPPGTYWGRDPLPNCCLLLLARKINLNNELVGNGPLWKKTLQTLIKK